jgi:hypothetical protein
MQCICTHVLRVPVPIQDLGTHAYDQTALPLRKTKIGDVLLIGNIIGGHFRIEHQMHLTPPPNY